MNKFILVAMNRKNHTQEELNENSDAAYAYADDADAAAYAAAYAAAHYAAYAAAHYAASYWVNRYFEITGEDKQTYINEIERINNMKTVMDAVNEFKGGWPSSDTIVMYYTAGADEYGFYSHVNKGLDAKCFTSEEFNALVFDMTVNFGESSLKHLYIWQEGIKRQPETDEQHTDKLNEMDKELDVMKDKPKPVFTQAMADNGELPVVGMEFMWRSWGEDEVCEMLGVYGDECWIKCDGKTLVVGNITNVKPIDTRTDKEKAIDEIREEYLAYTGKEMGAFEFAYNKWVGE